MVPIFYGVDEPYNKVELQDMLGFGFMLIAGQFFFWTAGTLLAFQLERPVFLREQANKMYDVKPYFFAKNILEAPFALLTPLISLLVTYWCCGFKHNATDFFKLYLVLFLLVHNSIGLGLMLSAFAKSEVMAITMLPLVNMPTMILGGLLANGDALKAYISWAQWLSVARYSNEAIMTVLLKDVNPLTNKLLEIEGFTHGYWWCVAFLVGFAILWRVISFVALKLSIKKFQ